MSRFGTWNVQGQSKKINEVLYGLHQLKYVAVIIEVKKEGKGSKN